MDVNRALYVHCTATFQYTKMKKPALKTVLATDIIQVHVHLKEHYMYHHGTTNIGRRWQHTFLYKPNILSFL